MSAAHVVDPPAPSWRCRWCQSRTGRVVLDLGEQPAADRFPLTLDPEDDPRYPLRMVMCGSCRLAQLEDDPTAAEEPLGVEPAALVRQAEQAVADLVGAGLACPGARVEEFPSPHGGNWSGLLEQAGLVTRPDESSRVDLVVDSLGLMHAPDQRKALAERVDRLAEGGVLAVHVHTMGSILQHGMWNVLRHGHFAYYALPVLIDMAAEFELVPVGAWEYPLYGGTTVVAFARTGSEVDRRPPTPERARIETLVEREESSGATDQVAVAELRRTATRSARALGEYLAGAERQGLRVAAYGAASRAIALLGLAGTGANDLMAIGDAARAKHGRAVPGSRIPIVAPDRLMQLRPDRVLLFVPDLLTEVRRANPEFEARGGRWVLLDPIPRVISP